MRSGGLECTKLTYIRLEDNLIRHRGDILCSCVLLLLFSFFAERTPGVPFFFNMGCAEKPACRIFSVLMQHAYPPPPPSPLLSSPVFSFRCFGWCFFVLLVSCDTIAMICLRCEPAAPSSGPAGSEDASTVARVLFNSQVSEAVFVVIDRTPSSVIPITSIANNTYLTNLTNTTVSSHQAHRSPVARHADLQSTHQSRQFCATWLTSALLLCVVIEFTYCCNVRT